MRGGGGRGRGTRTRTGTERKKDWRSRIVSVFVVVLGPSII